MLVEAVASVNHDSTGLGLGGDLGTQPFHPLDVALRQLLTTLTFGSSLLHPITQEALIHTQISRDLRNRLLGLFNEPDRSPTEPLVMPLPRPWRLIPDRRYLGDLEGTPPPGGYRHR